jgi:hypothetical protein
MCFQDSSTPTRSLTGSLCAAVAILVGWCVWTSWENRKEEPCILHFAEEEENTVVDDSDGKSLLSSLLGRLMSLPIVPKARGEAPDVEMTAV